MPPSGDPIIVGSSLSLTGSLARDGQLVKEGYVFCQEWVNANGGIELNGTHRPLEIRIENDASRVSVSADNVERLVSRDGVKLLLGPSNNATTARDARIAEAHQVPMVEGNGPSDSIFNSHFHYVFGVLAPASRQMEGVIDLALVQDLKPQSVAILTADDSLSTEIAGEARAYALSRGLNVVYFGSFASGTNDLRGQLSAAAATSPDLVLESGHLGESILTMRQAQQLNIQPRLFAFTQEPTASGFISQLKKSANYVVGTTQWSPLAKVASSYFLSGRDYASQFQARFGHPPDQVSAGATAACVALVAAIHRAGSTDPAPVRDALAALDIHTFFGEIRFDGRGANPSKAVFVEQVQAGKIVVVWPPEAASGTAQYPTPAWNKR